MIYHVYANRSNAGDWFSAQGIQKLLRPRVVKELLCDDPFVPKTIDTLKNATPADFIIIGGGGLLMDYFLPFWTAFLPIAERVPFVLWGVGACDMKTEHTRLPRELLLSISASARLCIVRDELTREALGGNAIPPPVVCPTFVSVPSVPQAGTCLLHVDHYDNVGASIYELMVDEAQRFAAKHGRRYRQTNNLLPSGNKGALSRILELYASASSVVTSRLHGCILALATGRPVLAVSGDHKVESFMKAAGLGDWVLDLSQIDQLSDRLDSLHEQILPTQFIARARKENEAVGRYVGGLIDMGPRSCTTSARQSCRAAQAL